MIKNPLDLGAPTGTDVEADAHLWARYEARGVTREQAEMFAMSLPTAEYRRLVFEAGKLRATLA